MAAKPDKVRVWIVTGMIKAVNVASKPGHGRPRYRISCEELANFQTRQAAKLLPAACTTASASTDACGFFPRSGRLAGSRPLPRPATQ